MMVSSLLDVLALACLICMTTVTAVRNGAQTIGQRLRAARICSTSLHGHHLLLTWRRIALSTIDVTGCFVTRR